MSILERSLADLQHALTRGEVTALDIVVACLARIEEVNLRGPAIRAVLEVNPEAEAIASGFDAERHGGRIRGPLHGIPILLKDNIDTADEMETTAGSLALLGSRPARDASVARRLRGAGAILLGKANMSEWANFRSDSSSSGWSARGGQALNPYILDRSPSGSSSGSATAVAALLAPASLGTETSGSILSPASASGVVGIKPTVGLTSRAGVLPIAHSQDTVGPFGRTVADAALVLDAIAGRDPRDQATMSQPGPGSSYTGALRSASLRGCRIGVPRETFFGHDAGADRLVDTAIAVLRDRGATIVDPAEIPTAASIREDNAMIELMLYEFKADLNAYLAERQAPVRTLADLIDFNRDHAAEEMAHFEQEIFERAEAKGPLTEQAYLDARASSRRLAGPEGIDAVLQKHELHALIAPTAPPAFRIDLETGDGEWRGSAGIPARAGYPAVSVPVGFAGELPVGATLMGTAWSESILIGIADALQRGLSIWHPPRFLESV